MPKRIPHLAETIVTQASRLFSKLGYDAVDMKMVAAESGTSVGNLYNYFPSKPALFLAIKDHWRQSLLENCRAILSSEGPRRERILTVLERLYDDISAWQGLWTEFLGGQKERDHVLRRQNESKARMPGPFGGFGPDEVAFLGEFEALITGVPGMVSPQRWSILLITATVQMARRFPSDREENWKFLETLVDKL